MSQSTPAGSFFPGSRVIVNDGSFTMQNITNYNNGGKGGYERLLDVVAPNALHDSGHIVDPPKCHPGTRVAIIETIIEWIAGENEANRYKLFTWLTGAAGSGKSAIGRSVCERCAEEGTLLGSFFFGSRDPTRNHSKSFAATIAYQICLMNPGLRTAISSAVDHDPLVFTRSLRKQLMSLVAAPLVANFANEPSHPPRLIVVDGLDECLDEASQQDILDSLFHFATTSAIPIRILVCSRRESQIVTMFSATNMSAQLFKILLDHESYSSSRDIELYLRDEFQKIRETHIFKRSMPSPWPTQDQLDQVTKKSSGQFIYATIVVRYLKSSRHRPHQRLDAILGLRPPFKDLPFSELDALYLHLLNDTDDPMLAADILAFLALYDIMCPADINTFLNLGSGESEVTLSHLGAMVYMGPVYSDPCVAFLLHKSFGDFLFDSDRSKGLSKARTETKAWHALRVIELFSEHHESCRFQYTLGEHFSSSIRLGMDFISYKVWSTSAQLAFLNAVIHFPMKSYCKELSSHSHITCSDRLFLQEFFKLLCQLEQLQIITAELFHRHVDDFCNSAISVLKEKYTDHSYMHFIFTANYFDMPMRLKPRVFNSFSYVIQAVTATYCNAAIINKFQVLLSKSDKAVITSKAAMYCLQYLCNPSCAKEIAKLHLGIREMDRNHRKTRPWQWHQRASSRDLSRSPVLVVHKYLHPAKMKPSLFCLNNGLSKRNRFKPVYTLNR